MDWGMDDVIDDPSLVLLYALPLPDHAALLAHAMRLPEVAAMVKRLEEAWVVLHFYADFHENPNDGPWGVNSQDFGKAARAFLAGGE
jgi:hypothetical protein